jgi:hypothetical protein
MHKRGECRCQVIFDAEERKRRTRAWIGKGKSRSEEVCRKSEIFGIGRRDGTSGYEYIEVGREQELYDQEYEYGPGTGRSEKGAYKYEHGGSSIMQATNMQVEYAAAHHQYVRTESFPEAQVAAYEYVGYFITGKGAAQASEQTAERVGIERVGRSQNFPPVGQGQMVLDQSGAGMNWRAQKLPEMPTLLDSQVATHRILDATPPAWQKTKLELEPVDAARSHNPTTPVIATLVTVTENQAKTIPESNIEMPNAGVPHIPLELSRAMELS